MKAKKPRWTNLCHEWFAISQDAAQTAWRTMQPCLLGAGLMYHAADAALRGDKVAKAVLTYGQKHVQDNGVSRLPTEAEAEKLAEALKLYRLPPRLLKSYLRFHP